jgi:hypothetical protein
MEKTLIPLSVLLASLAIATAGYAATVSWSLPASYSDGTPIAPADIQQIQVKVYKSPGKGGPWKWVATSPPGATSIKVEDPPPGHTLWYTVKSSLYGAESEYAQPVRKTNFDILPLAKKVMRKMITPRKMTALLFLLLLGGLVWYFRYRGKGGKGDGQNGA